MNLTDMIIGCIGALAVASGSFLLASFLMALMDHPKACGWLRCSICVAGIVFSSTTSVFYALATLFRKGGRLSGSELTELWIGFAMLSLPMIVGLLAAMGTKNRLVRKSGNALVFGISPAVFLTALASDPMFQSLLPILAAGVVGTMMAWGNLVLAGRKVTLPA